MSMKITRWSPISRKDNTLEIDVTEEQITAWANGALIQTVMPQLSKEQREFLISGITPDEFEKFFLEEGL